MVDDKSPKQKKRRILCIDGGGIRGTFPAALLAKFEQDLGSDHPIGYYFDLIAGTSTGGIIAIALALGQSAEEILKLYQTKGPSIFGQDQGTIKNYLNKILRGIRWCCRNKYDLEVLRGVLENDGVLGSRCIGHANRRLVIPAWNSDAKSVYIYKTAHHERFRTDYKSSAVDVALATAAAPTYFQQHITQHDVGLHDGGVWANNPIVIAVVEAIAVLGWPRDSLNILSIGCLEEAYTIPKWAGIMTLREKAIKLFMDGQSQGALGTAKLLTGHTHEHQALHRIDQTVPYNSYPMDDTKKIQQLKGLGHNKGREQFPILKPIFFDKPAEKFIPFYQLNEDSYDN